MDEQFTVNDLHSAFGIDALESSRPINFKVNTPYEINRKCLTLFHTKKVNLINREFSFEHFGQFINLISDFNIKAVASSAPVLTFLGSLLLDVA
jgi:hypothetical protein